MSFEADAASATVRQGLQYNAVVESSRLIHDELMILRVRPDAPLASYLAGQYAQLGLGVWEPRVDRISSRSDSGSSQKLLRRAYSISCPMLDEKSRLVTVGALPFLEFYLTLVRRPGDDPPMLSPRLFALRDGSRLFIGSYARGRYTLEPIRHDDNIVFAATGTGEAPHNAMIAELLCRGHGGRIVNCVCVRFARDLAYLQTHRQLEQMFASYRYFPLTTREPRNVDSSRADYVGKRYLQHFFGSGNFERETGLQLDPERTHVYLCGNPAMIGAPLPGARGQPQSGGMAERLVTRGFRLDQPRCAGNVHFETYW
jgi:ferredoxin--NADP+ reductase